LTTSGAPAELFRVRSRRCGIDSMRRALLLPVVAEVAAKLWRRLATRRELFIIRWVWWFVVAVAVVLACPENAARPRLY